jgi:hypothetical protein
VHLWNPSGRDAGVGLGVVVVGAGPGAGLKCSRGVDVNFGSICSLLLETFHMDVRVVVDVGSAWCPLIPDEFPLVLKVVDVGSRCSLLADFTFSVAVFLGGNMQRGSRKIPDDMLEVSTPLCLLAALMLIQREILAWLKSVQR